MAAITDQRPASAPLPPPPSGRSCSPSPRSPGCPSSSAVRARAFGLVYGALVASWLQLQTIFAEAEHRRQARVPRTRRAEALTVVIPTYRETADAVIAGIRSILEQDYDGRIDVIVVDVDSPGEQGGRPESGACVPHGRLAQFGGQPEQRRMIHAGCR